MLIYLKSLGRFPNRVDVHAVGARTDHTAQTACSELKILVKTLFNLLLIIPDRQKLLLRRIICGRGGALSGGQRDQGLCV